MSSANVTSAAPVIDLTEEDTGGSYGGDGDVTTHRAPDAGSSRAHRLPRFGRDVIDVDSEVDQFEDRHATPAPPGFFESLRRHRPQYSGLRRPARLPSPPRDMDEIEFLAERPLSRPQTMSRQPTPPTYVPRSVTPYPGDFRDAIDLTADDDVIITDARARDGVNVERPGVTAGLGTRSVADFGNMGGIADLLRSGSRLMQRVTGLEGGIHPFPHGLEYLNDDHPPHHHHYQHHRHVHNNAVHGVSHRMAPRMTVHTALPDMVNAQNLLPAMMDYAAPGFDLGLPGANRPPTPKYSPPPEPEEGFTRNPAEDEVVVCPLCGDELAMGENEVKQQVWVVKGCGHVSAACLERSYRCGC